MSSNISNEKNTLHEKIDNTTNEDIDGQIKKFIEDPSPKNQEKLFAEISNIYRGNEKVWDILEKIAEQVGQDKKKFTQEFVDYEDNPVDMSNHDTDNSTDLTKKRSGKADAWRGDNGKFLAPRLSKIIMQENHFLYERGQLFVYENGIYQRDAANLIRREVMRKMNDDFTSYRGVEVIKYITNTYKDEAVLNINSGGDKLDNNLEYIPLLNGILNWKTGKLLPHTPDIPFSYIIPLKYDPKAKCPKISVFLKEILPHDCIYLILQLFGYLLIPDTSMQVAFLFLGGGENGKSKLLELITKFIGEFNVSNDSIHDIAENRFRSSNLNGKLANIYADIDGRFFKNTGIFKALVSGDRITVERKNEHSYVLKNFARLIFSANRIPVVEDLSEAYFRRWKIIRFPNKFPPGSRNTKIIEQIATKDELSGLLNLAIKALRDLMQKSQFDNPESVQNEMNIYRGKIDPCGSFLREKCEIREDAEVGIAEFYDEFEKFCEKNGHDLIGKQKFNKRLKETIPAIKEVKRDTKRFWKGIKLVSDDKPVKIIAPFKI